MPNELSRIVADIVERGGRIIVSSACATKGEATIVDGSVYAGGTHLIVFHDDEDMRAFIAKLRGFGLELEGKLG